MARDRARYKLIKGADILPISYLPRQLLKVDGRDFKNQINLSDPVKQLTDKSKARKRLKREGLF